MWEALMFIFFVVEAVVTLFECKWSGIWICIVRFLAGTFMGVVAGVALILFLGIVAIVGYALISVREVTIKRNGETIRLRSVDEDGNSYYDPETGETFCLNNKNMVTSEVDGRRYNVY